MEKLSYEEKINMIRQRYRSTKDLWLYLTERCTYTPLLLLLLLCFIGGYLMPSLKNCRLKHIQDIFAGRKKVLLLEKCCAKKVPSWPEMSVKNCYPLVIENCPDITDYLPDPHGKEQRLPEKEFFWTVVYTLYYQHVEDYIKEVE